MNSIYASNSKKWYGNMNKSNFHCWRCDTGQDILKICVLVGLTGNFLLLKLCAHTRMALIQVGRADVIHTHSGLGQKNMWNAPVHSSNQVGQTHAMMLWQKKQLQQMGSKEKKVKENGEGLCDAPKKHTKYFWKKFCYTIQNRDLNIILSTEGCTQLTARWTIPDAKKTWRHWLCPSAL